MKFVALVSGGKDSCFNILHCLSEGHELECLGNLYPPLSDSDELDSFMYQTVGHNVLSYYEECIGVPMYRQMISGGSKNQSLEYKKTDNDETEDLYALLSTVKKNHPDVLGVSVGAILSSYQRTRVEDVCARLGLTALSFLWQRDQTELMGEMCNSGMDARLIKVAAIGLNDKNLGMTLQQAYPVLLNLNNRFGVHVCGEGGEFETLVFDAPFFKRGRLIITESEVIKHTNDEVWYLKLKVEVEKKDEAKFNENIDYKKYVLVPPLLKEKFQEIKEQLPSISASKKTSVSLIERPLWELNSKMVGEKIYIENITSDKLSLEDQVIDIFTILKQEIDKSGLTMQHIQTSSFLVSSMTTFADVNKIYSSYFTEPLPPSRVCVETNLPKSCHAQLSVTVLKDLSKKAGLHVQGRSYWAPSNIGPYSQAVMDEQDYVQCVSGQIPLIPRNMEVMEDESTACCLSLQHFDNVKEVTGYIKQLFMVAFINDSNIVPLVNKTWEEYIFEDSAYADNFLSVEVNVLPKGCCVEWGGITYKEIDNSYYDSEDEDDDTTKEAATNGRVVKVNFANDLASCASRINKKSHYKVYGNPEKLSGKLTMFDSYEFIPVKAVYDRNGEVYAFGLVELHI